MIGHASGAQATVFFILVVLPVLAVVFAQYHTRGLAPIAIARETSGIAGVLAIVVALGAERLFNPGPPDADTLRAVAIGTVPMIPRLLLLPERPSNQAMVPASLVGGAIGALLTLAAVLLGLVGSMAEPGYTGGAGAYAVLLPAGCFVALEAKMILALVRSRLEAPERKEP